MPAFFNNSRVGLTRFCNLSSTPVKHKSSISLSKFSITLLTILFRSVVLNLAALYFTFKNYSHDNYKLPILNIIIIIIVDYEIKKIYNNIVIEPEIIFDMIF